MVVAMKYFPGMQFSYWTVEYVLQISNLCDPLLNVSTNSLTQIPWVLPSADETKLDRNLVVRSFALQFRPTCMGGATELREFELFWVFCFSSFGVCHGAYFIGELGILVN